MSTQVSLLDSVSFTGSVAAAAASATATFTNGSANIGWTAHGFSVGQAVFFTTSGTLPTNFTAGSATTNNYYVVSVPDANTIQVAATPGGTAITAGSAGTGTQTGTQILTLVQLDMSQLGSTTVQITSAGTTCTISYVSSEDQQTWFASNGYGLNSTNTSAVVNSSSTTATAFNFPRRGRYFRAYVSTYTSGTVSIKGSGALHMTGQQALSNCVVTGTVAHGTAVSGSPNRMGGRARTYGTPYTALSADQTADLVTDLIGNLKVTQECSYSHISSNATTTVKSGAGSLRGITINTKGASANTATVYDNTAGSGTVIAVIDTTAAVGTLSYDIAFTTGLTVVTATGTAPDMTIAYR